MASAASAKNDHLGRFVTDLAGFVKECLRDARFLVSRLLRSLNGPCSKGITTILLPLLITTKSTALPQKQIPSNHSNTYQKMTKLKLSTGVALILGAFTFPAHAVTVSVPQTFNFPFTFSAVTPSASVQNVFLPDPGTFVATVLPFNTNLGTLDSVNVKWTFGGSWSAVSGESGGSATINLSGTAYVNATAYNSNGSGGSNSAAANTSFSVVQSPTYIDNTFIGANAGVTYNAVLWSALSGNSSYLVKLDKGATNRIAYYANLASGTLTTNTDLVVTYNYTAAAVPEPGAFLPAAALVMGAFLRRRRGRARRSGRAAA
jgi:hypothetical protein